MSERDLDAVAAQSGAGARRGAEELWSHVHAALDARRDPLADESVLRALEDWPEELHAVFELSRALTPQPVRTVSHPTPLRRRSFAWVAAALVLAVAGLWWATTRPSQAADTSRLQARADAPLQGPVAHAEAGGTLGATSSATSARPVSADGLSRVSSDAPRPGIHSFELEYVRTHPGSGSEERVTLTQSAERRRLHPNSTPRLSPVRLVASTTHAPTHSSSRPRSHIPAAVGLVEFGIAHHRPASH